MKVLLATLLIVSLPLAAQAERIIVVDGDRVILVDTTAGTSTRIAADRVITTGSGPVDPVDPVDPESETSKLAKKLADQVSDEANRAKLSAVFEFLAASVTSELIKPTEASMVMRQTVAATLGDAATREKWKPFSDGMEGEVARYIQNGAFRTKDQVAGFFVDVRDGLDSAGGEAALNRDKRKRRREIVRDFVKRAKEDAGPGGFDIARLLEILKLVLDFLKTIGVL